MITACEDRFAFASTLAIYIYDMATFQLLKLIAFGDRNLTCMEWCPTDSSVIAQGTIDKMLVLWDVESESVKFQVSLPSAVTQMCWSRRDPNVLFFILNNGKPTLCARVLWHQPDSLCAT